ncbi:hypothetical protein NDU88_007142 [Pleurodeles waltl]|uniref:Uncharacterized protein n=1 Tax=Pleurodeles waltl TaxID=8319 RepID=A0AAV7U266_PLEWA|nr:hypothetical protein NDU88_007142 [Pleurodeles waltl]
MVCAPGKQEEEETPAGRRGRAEEAGVTGEDDGRLLQRPVKSQKASWVWKRTESSPEGFTSPTAAQEAHRKVSSHASGEAWLTQSSQKYSQGFEKDLLVHRPTRTPVRLVLSLPLAARKRPGEKPFPLAPCRSRGNLTRSKGGFLPFTRRKKGSGAGDRGSRREDENEERRKQKIQKTPKLLFWRTNLSWDPEPWRPVAETRTAGPGEHTSEPPRFWRSVAKPGTGQGERSGRREEKGKKITGTALRERGKEGERSKKPEGK